MAMLSPKFASAQMLLVLTLSKAPARVLVIAETFPISSTIPVNIGFHQNIFFEPFEFYILLESIKREKREKAAFAKFIGDLAVEVGGADPGKIALLLIEYEEELHQFKYNYRYVSVEQRLKAIQTDGRSEDATLLDKVSGLTASETNAGRPR